MWRRRGKEVDVSQKATAILFNGRIADTAKYSIAPKANHMYEVHIPF